MPEPLDDQHERTLLAWRRTALSLVAAGLLVGHLAIADAGSLAIVAMLVGLGAAVAFVWLSTDRWVGLTGIVLVAGVLLLGSLSLLGMAAG